MDRLTVRSAQESVESADRDFLPVLLCLTAGVWGFILLLESVPDMTFQSDVLFPLTLLLCLLLCLIRSRYYKVFLPGVLIFLGLVAYMAYQDREQLWRDFSTLVDAVRGTTGQTGQTGQASQSAPTTSDHTLLVVILTSYVALLLFYAECLLHSHVFSYLLVTALLLVAPLIGMPLSVHSVILLTVFQLSFWAWQVAGRHLHIGGHFAALPAHAMLCLTVLSVLCLAVGVYVVSQYSEPLYEGVALAEEMVYRQATGQSRNDPVTGGHISRGNSHHTGAVHLHVYASEAPTESVYLRGFAGGEYIGGDWTRATDEDLFREMLRTYSWQRRYGAAVASYENIQSLYYSMYFALNSMRAPAPAYISLRIVHDSGSYETMYTPYTSMLGMQGLRTLAPLGSSKGYLFHYYEQKDIQTSPDGISQENLDTYMLCKDIQRAYMQQIQSAYTDVPTERLPKLCQLVADNPLEDLDEITTFILYTLHTHASYSLTPGWMTLNNDVAEDFLFVRHRGFCEHFALAATLLYRLYGIPARYCTGYRLDPDDFVPYTPMPSETTDPSPEFYFSDYFSLYSTNDWIQYTATALDTHAHAWVEIFLEDYGWTPVEVTPAVGDAVFPGFDAGTYWEVGKSKGWLKPIEQQLQRVETTKKHGQSAQSASDALLDRDASVWRDCRVIFWSTVFLLISCSPSLLWMRRRSRLQKTRDGGVRVVFAQLLGLLQSIGQLQGLDGSEADFAQQLSRAVPALSEQECADFVSCVICAAYAAPDRQHTGFDAWNFYARAAESIVQKLPRWQQLRVRYIGAYI